MRKTKFVSASILASLLAVTGCAAPTAQQDADPVETAVTKVQEDGEKEEVSSAEKEEIQEHEFFDVAVFGIDDESDGIKHQQADAIKLVSVDYDDQKVNIVSPARELLVYVGGDVQRIEKINDVFAYGGDALQLETVNSAFDLDFEKYISFDYEALKAAVDALGGVDIDLTQAEIDQTSRPLGIKGTAGTYTLNGEQAVKYCRIFKIDSDDARTDRVTKVVMAAAKKMKEAGPLQVASVVSKAYPYVRTNLRTDEIIQLVTDFLSFEKEDINKVNVPVETIDLEIGRTVESYGDLADSIHNALYNGFKKYERSAEFDAIDAKIQEALAELR